MNYCVRPGLPCDCEYCRTISDRLEFILACLGENVCDLILDIGTELGAYPSNLACRSDSYVGLDINESYLSAAKTSCSCGNVEFIRMSADHLGLRDSACNVVLLVEVIEHLVNDDGALDEIRRVLKPGGMLILTAPNRLFPFETHGLRIGGRIMGTKGFGIPFLPYLPNSVRNWIANARVYTLSRLKEALGSRDFLIRSVGYLSPAYDRMALNFPGLAELLRTCSRRMNSTMLSIFSPTIIIQAEKGLV